MSLVMNTYPDANYLKCPNQDECITLLKGNQCVLYPDDELQLIYRELLDPLSIEMTRERFNTQYIAWPMSYALDDVTRLLMKRWIYAAVSNATLDELYFKYFEAQLCPFGTAGEKCEDYCHPEHGLADIQGVCVCDSTKWTGDDCSVEVLEDPNLIPPTLKKLGFAMFGVNAAVVFICATWLYYHRDTTQVKVMQPFFLALVLLGCLISSSTILAMADESSSYDEDSVSGCMAIPWLYSVGFSVTYGTLFAKIRRVHILFRSAAEMRRVTVSIGEAVGIIAGVLLIDIAVLTAWTVTSPMHWSRYVLQADKYGDPLSSVGLCTGDNWMIFASLIAVLHFCLLGIACFLCYVTRNISTQFSESKYLAIAMVSNMQIFVVGVPVLIIVGADPETSFFVRSVIIWMNDLVVVSLIFGNLIWSVHNKPRMTIESSVRLAQQRYASSTNFRKSRGDGSDRQLMPGGGKTSIRGNAVRLASFGDHKSGLDDASASFRNSHFEDSGGRSKPSMDQIQEANKESESRSIKVSSELNPSTKDTTVMKSDEKSNDCGERSDSD